jgi:hypothetical protein
MVWHIVCIYHADLTIQYRARALFLVLSSSGDAETLCVNGEKSDFRSLFTIKGAREVDV